MLESFVGYRNAGLCPIPLRPGTKVPMVAWKRYQTSPPSMDDCLDWDLYRQALRPCNIGLVTGAAYNLVVVDADTPRQVSWCHIHLPRTVMVQTGRGVHFYYQANTPCERNRRAENFDVRGEGGYVVAPGSIHENGTRYEWMTPWQDTTTLPVFSEEFYYMED